MAQESKPSNPPIKTTPFSRCVWIQTCLDMFGVEGGTTLLKKQTCSYTSNSSFQTGKKGFGRSSTPPKNPKEDDRGVSTPHFFGNLRDPDASSAIRRGEDPPRWLWHQAAVGGLMLRMTSAEIWGERVFSNINCFWGQEDKNMIKQCFLIRHWSTGIQICIYKYTYV